MPEQSSMSLLSQELNQIEEFGSEQLILLIEQLECRKKKLPVKDHSVINWGIGVIKAKIQEEEEFMHEMDEAWKKQLGSEGSEFSFVYQLENIDISSQGGKAQVYTLGRDKLSKILSLSAEEGFLRKYEFEESIGQVKRDLYQFCSTKGEGHFYLELIQGYQADFGAYPPGEEFSPYYEALDRILGKPGF